jgi:hypothetical protein
MIFLAFANDRSDGVGYLRNLPDEARRGQRAINGWSCMMDERYKPSWPTVVPLIERNKRDGRQDSGNCKHQA